VGSGALEPRRGTLVADDHDAISAQPNVELKVRHSGGERAPEGFERVARADPARAAMSLDLEIHGPTRVAAIADVWVRAR